jgi:peroxiredoxin
MRVTTRILLIAVLFVGCDSEAAPDPPAVPVGTEVGQRAPQLSGQLPAAEPFTIDVDGTPTVLVFYRSFGCGLCRVQLEQMQRNIPAYDRAGAELIALTLDAPETSRAWMDQAQVEFPVVSVDSATFRAWGAFDADRPSPLPATYVIDSSGIVRFRYIGRNASDRTSDAEIVAVLEGLAGT